ncbi:hypothetical protein [uncultured Clostridium sp.]|uniref:hypothetical protein n=1 Tax=uncultured Clostridium sp. TaxID=59620 RepID=UPI0026EAD5AB|nr:hypothetical protein [uncultured Clostridium sp.]
MDLFDLASNDSQEVLELERNIPIYAKAYYEGNAIISDTEFDKLVDRLKELKPNSTILHTPRMGL